MHVVVLMRRFAMSCKVVAYVIRAQSPPVKQHTHPVVSRVPCAVCVLQVSPFLLPRAALQGSQQASLVASAAGFRD